MLHAPTRHTFGFTASRRHLPLHTVLASRRRNPVPPFLSSTRVMGGISRNTVFNVWSFTNLFVPGVTFWKFTLPPFRPPALFLVIRIQWQILTTRFERLSLSLRMRYLSLRAITCCCLSPTPSTPVHWLHRLRRYLSPLSLLLTIMIGPRLVNISMSSLPTQISLSGSVAKTPRCPPVQARPTPRYSMTNSVRFSTQSLLTTLRGRPSRYGC